MMDKPKFPLMYAGKRGGIYKSTGTITLTPDSAASAGDIIGSIRWTDSNYYLVLTAFGVRYCTTTGLSAGDLMGVTITPATSFTVADTDGTDVSSDVMQPIRSDMPDITNFEAYICASDAVMTAGTRTLGNPVYSSIAIAGTAAAVVQEGRIYSLDGDTQEPIILEENTGLEFLLAEDIDASKNITVSLMATWQKIPIEIMDKYYKAQL